MPGTRRFFQIFFALIFNLQNPEKLKDNFAELGPTFIKLGQLLSARPDLVPKRYSDEFEKLLDKVPQTKYENVLRMLETEFGKIHTAKFTHVSQDAVASASIAQVHVGFLANGTKLAIKIRHPDITKQIETDLKILRILTKIIAKLRLTGGVDVTAINDSFSEWIMGELNFQVEAQRIKRFKKNLEQDQNMVIPAVIDDLTNDWILTMDFIEGITISSVIEMMHKKNTKDPNDLEFPYPIDFERVVYNLVESFLFNQMLRQGYFHADPHPGNLMILPDNKLGLLDYGIVGILDRKEHKQVILLTLGVIQNDPNLLVQLMSTISETRLSHREKLKIETKMSKVLHSIHSGEISKANSARVMLILLEEGKRFGIQLGTGIILGIRTVALLEGIGVRLVPSRSLIEILKPHVRKFLVKELQDEFTEESLYRKLIKLLSLEEQTSNLFSIIDEDGLKISLSEKDHV